MRPETLRIYDLGTNFRRRAPDVLTLPQHFKAKGYASHGLGKIFHVGHGNHEDPASWSVPHYQVKSVQYVLPENRAQLTREEALFSNKQGDVNQLPRGAAFESADVADEAYADGRIADVPADVGQLILRRLRPEDLRALEAASGVAIDHVSVQLMARPAATRELE